MVHHVIMATSFSAVLRLRRDSSETYPTDKPTMQPETAQMLYESLQQSCSVTIRALSKASTRDHRAEDSRRLVSSMRHQRPRDLYVHEKDGVYNSALAMFQSS